MGKRENNMIKNPAFYFNADTCVGCKACMIACKDKHNNPVGILWRRVAEFSGGEWILNNNAYRQNVFAYYVSISCNHCENPLCAKACPSMATHKTEEGIVRIDQTKCVGCRYCEWSCPYGAPQYDMENKVMTKCDFCYDYLQEGKTPSCVAACPSRSLDFGNYDELVVKYGTHGTIAPLPSSDKTRPHLIINPNRNSKPEGSEMGIRGSRVSNPEEI